MSRTSAERPGFTKKFLACATLRATTDCSPTAWRKKSVLLLLGRGSTAHPLEFPGGIIPPHDGSGQNHLAFAISAEQILAWEKQLGEHRIAIESRVYWPLGGTSIYFRDPDDNLLELATPGIWPIY